MFDLRHGQLASALWLAVAIATAACGSGGNGSDDDDAAVSDDAGVSDDAAVDADVDAEVPIAPAAPAGVSATDGASHAQVTITWTAVTNATAYDIYRDGALLAANIAATSYDDASAAAGGEPAAPTALTASDGTRATDVQLTWTAATAPAGTAHSYMVRAKNAAGTSADSSADTGYRGAYAVQCDRGAR